MSPQVRKFLLVSLHNFCDWFGALISILYDFYNVTWRFLFSVCYPYLVGGLQCQCEEGFAWPCDKCDLNSSCSNGTTEICTCRNGLPPDGEFCEPITSKHCCCNKNDAISKKVTNICCVCLTVLCVLTWTCLGLCLIMF